MILTTYDLARMIDISCVRSQSSYDDIQEMISIAKEYKFICAHTLPCNVEYARQLLQGNTDVLIGCPVGFPAGGNEISIKVAEMEKCVETGAQEIDVVMNIGWLVSERYQAAEKELTEILKHAGSVPTKAIIEVSLLNDEMIRNASKIALNAGASFVKTGTGWTGIPTNYHHIEVIQQAVGNRIKIKASGGIKDLETLIKMYKMGVSRFGIGTKSAIGIIDEMKLYTDGLEV